VPHAVGVEWWLGLCVPGLRPGQTFTYAQIVHRRAFIPYPLDLQCQGEFPFDGLITRMPLAVRDNGSGDGPSAAVLGPRQLRIYRAKIGPNLRAGCSSMSKSSLSTQSHHLWPGRQLNTDQCAATEF
jgi:hypothetical protein